MVGVVPAMVLAVAVVVLEGGKGRTLWYDFGLTTLSSRSVAGLCHEYVV